MPVTLKSGLLKYKSASTGQYVEINAVSDNATASQVSTIQSAGATQVAAVQAQGATTLASIPQDYTTLSNSVDDLKSASVYNGDYKVVTHEMMQGCSTLHNYFNAYRVSMGRHKISPVTSTEFDIIGTNSNSAIIIVDGLTAETVYKIAFNYTNGTGYVRVYDTDDTTMLATSTGTSVTNEIREFTPPHTSVHVHVYGVNGITKRFAYMGIFEKNDPYGIATNFNNSIYNGKFDRDLTGEKTSGVVKKSIATLSNATLTIDTEYNELGGYEIAFRANVVNMRNITFGKGRYETYGAAITITSTEIQIGNYTFEHGLTITDYIACSVTFLPANARCAVRLSTHGGVFTKPASELAYSARKGKPFITVWGNGSLANVELSYYSAAWLHKVWMFGDSYFNIGEPARWTSYIPQMVKKRYIMMNGYPGASSANEYPALMAALEKEIPDYVIWCLGMNDTYSIWLENLLKVQKVCAEKRIKLIPATIPNVTSRNNQDKNEYVRTNFDEYIEFALAVNTGDDTTVWFDGMLSDDAVHPTNEGAIALYSAACATIPLLCAEE